MWTKDRPPLNDPLVEWAEALDAPGARQMFHGRRPIESRPIPGRIQDDSVVVTDRVATSVPGAGRYRFVATRDEAGTFAFLYVPVSRPFSVRMDAIHGPSVKAWWYNPRDGQATPIGEFPDEGTRQFSPPDPGETTDWVLVLDDDARHNPPPGQPPKP